MKKLPFLHLATSDEVASTHLLTPYEVGCVWKLRLQLWENNSIPLKDNDSYLAKICNTTPKKFRSARVNFDYLFEKENGKIFLNIRFLWLGVKIIFVSCRRLSFEWIDQVRGIL